VAEKAFHEGYCEKKLLSASGASEKNFGSQHLNLEFATPKFVVRNTYIFSLQHLNLEFAVLEF
jgi:hypothetical protein